MSHSFRCTMVAGLLVGTVGTACGGTDRSCDTPPGGLPVRYVGQAYGYGTIDVSWNDETQQHRVSAQMVGPESAAVIHLPGEGVCKEGVLRARLGGGRDDASLLRVLGGGLVILLDHQPMPSVVGLWDVRVVRDDEPEDGPDGRRIRGMFETVDPSDIPRGPEPGDDPSEPNEPAR